MTKEQKNNPLHGIKLEMLVNEIVDHYGWDALANELNLNCFKQNPSVKSTLKFLRRTEWAREKVERFYLYDYKQLLRARDDEYDIPPRQRVIPPSTKTKPAKSEDLTVDSKKQSKKPSSPWANSKHLK